MTPQDKAKEIFDRMYQVDDIMGNYPMCFDTAKQCALIAVDEVLSIKKEIWDDFHREYFDYWQQVKTEIEKL
jgi:hypothetical protein